jgi:hypothetical protein
MTHENKMTDLPKGVGDTAITSMCLDIVEQYQSNRISKGDALYKFTKTIPSGETQAEESPGKTLKSYLSMLDDWDHEHTLSDANERRDMERDEHHFEEDNEQHKRAREVQRDRDDDEGEKPVYKQSKINPELFPWAIADRYEGDEL